MSNRLVCLIAILFTAMGHPLYSQLTSDILSGLEVRHIGPAVMSGRIVDLAVVEQDPYTFYVASSTGGVWKTENNGVTFTPVFENEGTHSVGAIAVHQSDTNIVWVGTGERANRQSSSWGDGVYKSVDAGKTWTHMGLVESHHIGRIALHPDNPDIVFIAAMGHLWGPNEERGLYKSTNGGESWAKVLFVDENTGAVDVAIDHEQPDIMYAATYQRRRRPYGFHGGGPGSALYKSTDGGENWTKLTDSLPEGDYGRIGISIYRSNSEIVYICLEQGWQYNASTAYGERRAGVYRSDDRGESWTHMSDWNPRPMYASQILVDPNDDQRIYMQNSFSYSDDGGKKFTRARQSLHGDDRILWVNPRDSRHIIKGDDGGLGISYDRAETWLYITHLPVSQFYRISVDMRKPYWVYGGLQDNGSWMGPSETYWSEGIINTDWIKTGGGDGFLNLVHLEDENILYGESQYLGLFKKNLETMESRSIRPGDPQGHISSRRNWDAWGPGVDPPELGNAMAPANWDGPFTLSVHDPNTIYAGTNKLWKSTDGGDSWRSLGDLTTGIDRRDMPVMGKRAHDSTLSLDDGIPYYPTITAIAESPVQQGVLYAGTDDGNIQISTDDGQSWVNVSGSLPGLPASSWISGIEPSRYDAGTAYLAVNNYRNDDFANYLFKTTDFGQTWISIVGDLTPNRVVRTVREDTRNNNVLYLGTELGLFVSIDGGRQWVELKNNMPTMAFNDLVIHPRDNDLVLGTHSRGVWILDNLQSIQSLNSTILASDAHLFEIAVAEMIRRSRKISHVGDMFFRGENPPVGATIDYYLGDAIAQAEIQIEILNSTGEHVADLEPDTTAGINRIIWNLRYDPIRIGGGSSDDDDDRPSWSRRGMPGPLVVPGLYTAVLTVKDQRYYQSFQVAEDPRIELPIEDRQAWTASLFEIIDLYKQVGGENRQFQRIGAKVGLLVKAGKDVDEESAAEIEDVQRMFGELLSRTRSLYGDAEDWTGRMSADQKSRLQYYRETLKKLIMRRDVVVNELLPRINKKLDKEDRILLEETKDH